MLTAGALAAPRLLSAMPEGKVVGLQLYTLRDQLPKDPKGVIAKVAAAGYKEVETFGYSKKGGFWGRDECPMLLNTFEYIARNALQAWWHWLGERATAATAETPETSGTDTSSAS